MNPPLDRRKRGTQKGRDSLERRLRRLRVPRSPGLRAPQPRGSATQARQTLPGRRVSPLQRALHLAALRLSSPSALQVCSLIVLETSPSEKVRGKLVVDEFI